MSSSFWINGVFSETFVHFHDEFEALDYEFEWVMKSILNAYQNLPPTRVATNTGPSGEALSLSLSLASCSAPGNFGLPSVPARGKHVSCFLQDVCFSKMLSLPLLADRREMSRLWLIDGDDMAITLFDLGASCGSVSNLLANGESPSSLDEYLSLRRGSRTHDNETLKDLYSSIRAKGWSFSKKDDLSRLSKALSCFLEDIQKTRSMSSTISLFSPWDGESLDCEVISVSPDFSLVSRVSDGLLQFIHHDSFDVEGLPMPVEGCRLNVVCSSKEAGWQDKLKSSWESSVLRKGESSGRQSVSAL